MKLQDVPRKAIDKSRRVGARWFGRDDVSWERVAKRSDLARLGTAYGGWVVPLDSLSSVSVCYCVGCGEDISFDLGLIERLGCDVFAFDPTPEAVAYVSRVASGNDHYRFSALGLWDKDEVLRFYVPSNPDHVSHSLLNLQKTEAFIEVPVDRLSHIMQRNGHPRIDLLKLDVEGAEYKVIDSLVEDRLDIGVICVEYDELHHALDGAYRARVAASIRKLLAFGYALVSVDGKANYTFIKVGNPSSLH